MYKQAEGNTKMYALKAPIHVNFEVTKNAIIFVGIVIMALGESLSLKNIFLLNISKE